MTERSQTSAVPATRLFLPQWWVRALEAFAEGESQNSGVLDLISRSGILPIIDGEELSILGLFVSSAQSQILTSQSPKFTIFDSDVIGESPFSGQAKASLVEKALAQLPVMRILSTDSQYAWSISDKFRLLQERGRRSIEIELNPVGEELILGFSHAHADLLRVSKNIPSLSKALGLKVPLCIWKSLWLDLDLNTQLIVMRIEKAMQHESSWVQLDGTASIDLDEAFKDVRFHGRKLHFTEFSRRRKVLEALGKKLLDHGVIDVGAKTGFLALMDRPGPQLIFRSKEGLLSGEHVNTYGESVAHYFSKRKISLQLIVSYAPEELKSWQSFYDSLSEEDRSLHVILGNRVFVAVDLFAEVFLRARGVWPDSFDNKFEKLPENPQVAWPLFLSQWRAFDFISRLKESGFSLASEASLAEIQIIRVLSTNNFQKNSNTAPEITTPQSNGRPQSSLMARDHRARSMVGEELDRLKNLDKKEYQKLCEAYVSSLREEERRLFQSIQKQMNPLVFETQLRARLIRFMIDNPSSWSSGKLGFGTSE